MLIIKLAFVIAFILSWMYSRRLSSRLSITDIFVASLLIVVVPYFIANPAATSQWSHLTFSPDVILKSELGVLMMLGTGSAALLLKGRLLLLKQPPGVPASQFALPRFSFGLALSITMLLAVALYLSPTFIEFRLLTIEFLFGALDATEYQVARRVTYSDSYLIQETVSRLRFSVFPILFIVLFSHIFVHSSIVPSVLLAAIFFVLFPLSFAKLPIAYYLGYIGLFFLSASRMSERMTIARISILAIVVMSLLILLLSGLYMIQYTTVHGFSSLLDKPLSLAFERIWGESYSILLRYFHVYPDVLRHTGVSSISLVSNVFGLDFRNTDLEVPYYFFGHGVLTSNPGLFIVSGYASFGYAGVFAYSILAFLIAAFLDYVRSVITNPALSSCYFAIVGVNVTFIPQLALPTALLSYGLGVIPVVFLLLNKLPSREAASSLRRPRPSRDAGPSGADGRTN